MDCEIGSVDMGDSTIDAISFFWAVENAIRSRNSSNVGALSRVHSFASVVDNAIRSRTASNLGTSHVDGFSSALVPNETEHVAAQSFTWAELVAATNNFSLDNKVGVGSFGGVVYRGKLFDGREVAIKRAETRSKKDRSLFWSKSNSVIKAELAFLSVFHHKHLVRLVGLCEEKKDSLLVYEYMQNGSLYDRLHHKNNVEKGSSVLNSWKMRIKIALDASRGIQYLHNHHEDIHIVHGNIKSSNILLDALWTARVYGFDFLYTKPESELYYRAMKAAKTVGSTDPDYCIPDYMFVKENSDEYHFGVVILELLTGKRAIFKSEVHGGTPLSVVDFAVPVILAGDLINILDPRVGPPDVNEAEAVKLVACTAINCVHLEGKDRPTITDVVVDLEKALAICDSSNDRISKVDIGTVSTRLSEVVPNETEHVASRLFTCAELVAATNNFSLENKIGAGGSGGVLYRGKLVDGREVAIKRAETRSKKDSSLFWSKSNCVIKAELAFLSVFHHKHLVRLVGLCGEKKDSLLVYEYMQNGSLYDHLPHKNNVEKGSSVLNSWKMRIKIALDASLGIQYLHNHNEVQFVHGNINSSNILLDATWTAKVSGFDFSFKYRESELYYEVMNAARTVGSVDPDYCIPDYMFVKENSDEYHFGVVMLELLTGKRAIFKSEVHGGTPLSVVDFAVPVILAGDLVNILDPRIGPPEGNEAEAVKLMARTAINCVHLEGKDRPTITDVVVDLEKALAICDSSNDRFFCSTESGVSLSKSESLTKSKGLNRLLIKVVGQWMNLMNRYHV